MRFALAALLLVTLVLGAVAPLRAATAPEKAEKLASKMLKSEKSLNEMTAQLEATLNSMNAMPSSKQEDLVKSYGAFTKNVATLESMAKKARGNSKKAASDRDAYLKKWKSSQDKIQNEQLKAAAKSRRDEILPKVDALKDSLASVGETFEPFMLGLKDLELYLGNDLSDRGLATASELMAKCNADGEKMRSDLAQAGASLKDLASTLQPGGAAK